MKHSFIIPLLVILLVSNSLTAQLTKVNQSCKQTPCEQGLYCITLKNGDQKCAACDQSTSDDLTRKVDDACKGFEEGWTPGASKDFSETLAADGRAQIDVFDIMLEKAKKCKEAREYREDKCWDDGDDDHKKAIKQVAESIERISTHKYRQINDKRVYYCSKSTYDSKLSTFNSKCNLKFQDLTYLLEGTEKKINNGEKINCSELEKIANDCGYCYEAAKDLYYYGFRDNSSYFPEEYNEAYTKSQKIMETAKKLREQAKSKGLCE